MSVIIRLRADNRLSVPFSEFFSKRALKVH